MKQQFHTYTSETAAIQSEVFIGFNECMYTLLNKADYKLN